MFFSSWNIEVQARESIEGAEQRMRESRNDKNHMTMETSGTRLERNGKVKMRW